jgi:hypothetical protein
VFTFWKEAGPLILVMPISGLNIELDHSKMERQPNSRWWQHWSHLFFCSLQVITQLSTKHLRVRQSTCTFLCSMLNTFNPLANTFVKHMTQDGADLHLDSKESCFSWQSCKEQQRYSAHDLLLPHIRKPLSFSL